MSNTLYKLRSFNRASPEDVELVNLMYYHPTVMKAKGYFSSRFRYGASADLEEVDCDLFTRKSRVSRKHEDVLYAVADRANRVVGWIWFYLDKKHPLPQGVRKMLGLSAVRDRTYGVSYEKLMSGGWPKQLLGKAQQIEPAYLSQERKGVIVSGLGQAIRKMRREFYALYPTRHKLVFYAFTTPSNIASQMVLRKNGFRQIERRYSYEGVLSFLWVKIA